MAIPKPTAANPVAVEINETTLPQIYYHQINFTVPTTLVFKMQRPLKASFIFDAHLVDAVTCFFVNENGVGQQINEFVIIGSGQYLAYVYLFIRMKILSNIGAIRVDERQADEDQICCARYTQR